MLLFHTSYEPPPLLQTPRGLTKSMPRVPALRWLEQGELRWVWEDGRAPAQPSWAVLQIQARDVRGQTRSCASRTQSQTLTAVSKQARALSAGSPDSSLVPITLQFQKIESFIYFGLAVICFQI